MTQLKQAQFKAILFDASNTLFFGDGGEFERANIYSVYYYLWQQGIDLNAEGLDAQKLWLQWEVLRQRPKGDFEHKQLTSTKADLKELFSTIDAIELAIELDGELLDKLEAVYYEGVVAATQALPNMHEVLSTLSKSYKLAVVSNTRSHYFIGESIRRAGLLDFFEVVVTSDRIGWRKPDARIFEAALVELGVNPTETVMIGDSLEKDSAGAKALSMYTIWLSLNSSSTAIPNVNADAEAKYPLEILDILTVLK